MSRHEGGPISVPIAKLLPKSAGSSPRTIPRAGAGLGVASSASQPSLLRSRWRPIPLTPAAAAAAAAAAARPAKPSGDRTFVETGGREAQYESTNNRKVAGS